MAYGSDARKRLSNSKEETEGSAQIPESAEALAAALCADYFRRERAIREENTPLRVRMEYEYLNRRIYTAARELCEGEEDALGYIEEIGARRGYAKSRFTVSEKTYKVKKRQVKLNILRRLYLLEAERGRGGNGAAQSFDDVQETENK